MTTFPIEVQILESKNYRNDIGSLIRTYEVLDWLSEQKMVASRDFDIDMHGGQMGYTSFWFKDKKKALLVKMTWG